MTTKTTEYCEADGCTVISRHYTYCREHRSKIKKCKVEWCEEHIHGRGYCLRHYNRFLWYGHPYLHPQVNRKPIPDYPLSVRDREVLRLLAHGEFVDIMDISEILGITDASVRHSIYKIRLRFGYDTVITDRIIGGFKLITKIPGVPKHPSLEQEWDGTV